MKVWILGAHGMLGSALRRLCKDRMIETVETGHEIDIAHLEKLKKFSHSTSAEGITHLINCAAYTDVDSAEKEKDLAYSVNALGPENIGTVANQMGAKVLHLSTDYVFGKGGDRPFLETDPCHPVGVYAETKWQGEQNLLDVCPTGCILRTSWVFGSGGKSFISSLLNKMQMCETLQVVSDQKGSPTYVRDLAEAVLSLLCHSGIFHFANAGDASRYEIALAVFKHAQTLKDLKCKTISPVLSSAFPTPAVRPSYSVLNTEKIASILGQTPRHWEEAFQEFLHATL